MAKLKKISACKASLHNSPHCAIRRPAWLLVRISEAEVAQEEAFVAEVEVGAGAEGVEGEAVSTALALLSVKSKLSGCYEVDGFDISYVS